MRPPWLKACPSKGQIETTLAVLSWLRGFVDNDTVRTEIDHVAIELGIAEEMP